MPNYLTLSGSGRTVEIGAFLSEEERLELKPALEDALQQLGQAYRSTPTLGSLSRGG